MFFLAAINAPALPVTPTSGGLPLNWFDFVVIIVAIAGIIRGRSRGLSQDLLDLLMWTGIVVGGAFACVPGGAMLAKAAGLSVFWSQIAVYAAVMFVAFVVKLILKDALKDKIAGSDIFRGAEYPLGMLSGMIRFVGMVIMVCALLHTRILTPQERAAARASQEKELGSVFFPWFEVQHGIFDESFTGKLLVAKAPWLLIPTDTTVRAQPPGPADAPSKRGQADKLW